MDEEIKMCKNWACCEKVFIDEEGEEFDICLGCLEFEKEQESELYFLELQEEERYFREN